jgi:predicted nucleic acid-binding protein
MTKYLVDTSILIDVSKAHSPVRAWMATLIAAGDVIGTCGIIVAEFYAGLPTRHYAIWAQAFGGLEYWEITPVVSVRAGRYRYEHARRGRQIATADALIAAVAADQDAVLVTHNVKDFPMPDIRVVSPPASM